jgi:hypothetical protein
LNGVYLNRQVLHKLNSSEVQDIMGHELGHYYRYYIVADRFRFVTLVLGALVGIVTAQLTFNTDMIGVLVLIGVAWGFWWISGLSWAKYGQTIEYLCDDLGGQVNGVIHSINGLMKIGADEELRYAIHAEMLANAKSFGNLSTAEIIASVESSIPYGHATAEDLREVITSELKQKARQGNLSVSGFVKYAWGADDNDEAIEEFRTTARVLAALPRLDWESLLPRDGGIRFDLAGAERLVRLIESNPDKVLFRLPDVGGSVDGIHPPLKDRILFLWHNHSGESSRLD